MSAPPKEVATGPSIAITSPKKGKGGAPVTINLEELLELLAAQEVVVLDAASGEDLTERTLTHALLSDDSKRDLPMVDAHYELPGRALALIRHPLKK